MTQFAPRELCEKLQKIRCESESGFYWVMIDGGYPKNNGDYVDDNWLLYHEFDFTKSRPYVVAFSQNDFTGATERARENARKAWPQSYNVSVSCPDRKPGCAVFHHEKVWVADERRHHMIDSEDWVKYLEETMRAAKAL